MSESGYEIERLYLQLQKVGMKRVDEAQIVTFERLKSWHFKCWVLRQSKSQHI